MIKEARSEQPSPGRTRVRASTAPAFWQHPATAPRPAARPAAGPPVWCRVVTIVPDTKDWTWVLERPCPECGLDTQRIPRDAIARMIRASADEWQHVLAGHETRRRPSPGVWSTLEY